MPAVAGLASASGSSESGRSSGREIDSDDTKVLATLYNELEQDHELIDELSRRFWQMDGGTSKIELSRCLIFFLLGQLYERKLHV